MNLVDKCPHLRESKRGPRLLKQISSLTTNHVKKEHAMTHKTNISETKIDTRAVARRLILLASIASATSACGMNIGRGLITVETTGYREEVNKSKFVNDLEARVKQNVSDDGRNHLSVRLAEVK